MKQHCILVYEMNCERHIIRLREKLNVRYSFARQFVRPKCVGRELEAADEVLNNGGGALEHKTRWRPVAREEPGARLRAAPNVVRAADGE